jgi:sterol 24-C-methyltransferase
LSFISSITALNPYSNRIQVGNGLPTLATPQHIIDCLEKSGFEVEDSYDANKGVHAANEIPWYDTLNGKMSLSGFRMTHVGRLVTHSMVWTLELLRIAPKVKIPSIYLHFKE